MADGHDEMGSNGAAGTRDRGLYEHPTLEIGTRPDPHDEGSIPRPCESDVVCLRCINAFPRGGLLECILVRGDGVTTFDASSSPGTPRLVFTPLLFG
jgi:hypothetical protein